MKKRKKILFAAWSCHNKNYYAYQTWDAPLRKIFQEVIVFDPQEYTYKYEKKAMNRKFLEIIEKEKPDYILLWLIYDEFYPETLFKIKKISPKTKVINFCGDDDAQFEDYSIYNSFFIDYSLITHKEFINTYKNKAFFSVGTNTDQFRPLNIEKKYEVTFIGTPKTDRVELIKYLIENGIKVNVFGSGWENYPEVKEIYGGFLDREDYTKVINQSKINLCFNKNYLGVTHVIQKFFEINACKSFLITEYCKGYSDLFIDNKELVMFRDKKELLYKIKYYLKKDKLREEIAERAYKKILSNYTSNVELKSIFDEIFRYNEDVPKKDLPKIRKKVIYLSLKNIELNKDQLKKDLKGYDYICFKTILGETLPYKEYFQIASLELFKKEISCCDYYVYSKGLGDYMAFYGKLAFKLMNREDFNKVIKLDQLMVKKYFLFDNLDKFKEFFKGKPIDIINNKNTAFVTRPFVRINKLPNLDYEKINKISWPRFENTIKSLVFKKDPLTILYLLNVLFLYALGNKFIFQYLIEKTKRKSKHLRIFKALFLKA